MKIRAQPRRGERGVAVVVVLAVVVLVLAFLAADNVSLRSLKQELVLLESRQLKHWESIGALLPPHAGPAMGDSVIAPVASRSPAQPFPPALGR